MIKLAGNIHLVLGSEVDAGLLIGVLLENKLIFENPAEFAEIKLKGDKLISEREAEKKKRAVKKTGDING